MLIAGSRKDMHSVKKAWQGGQARQKRVGIIGKLNPCHGREPGWTWDANPIGLPPTVHGLADKQVQQGGKGAPLPYPRVELLEVGAKAIHHGASTGVAQKGGNPADKPVAHAEPAKHGHEKRSVNRVKSFGKIAKDGHCVPLLMLQPWWESLHEQYCLANQPAAGKREL
jgi:hypothetical protein